MGRCWHLEAPTLASSYGMSRQALTKGAKSRSRARRNIQGTGAFALVSVGKPPNRPLRMRDLIPHALEKAPIAQNTKSGRVRRANAPRQKPATTPAATGISQFTDALNMPHSMACAARLCAILDLPTRSFHLFRHRRPQKLLLGKKNRTQ